MKLNIKYGGAFDEDEALCFALLAEAALMNRDGAFAYSQIDHAKQIYKKAKNSEQVSPYNEHKKRLLQSIREPRLSHGKRAR